MSRSRHRKFVPSDSFDFDKQEKRVDHRRERRAHRKSWKFQYEPETEFDEREETGPHATI